MRYRPVPLLVLLLAASPVAAQQGFDRDPGWEGFRNRLVPENPRVTRQHFGYRTTRKAGGGAAGEVGGWVQRAITPAYYGMPIAPRTLNDRLSASGRFAVHSDVSSTGTLVGWFNADESRGWRTSNSLAFRIDGNGGKYWVFFEYGTFDWQTGCKGCFEGDAYQTTRTRPFKADGTPHDWKLEYDPAGSGGDGIVHFTLDGTVYELKLTTGHKAAGATFNRFGVFNQQTTGGGMDVFFDDLVVDGRKVLFDEDPKWDAKGNDVEYADRALRPLQDFGFSPTHLAGGRSAGEIGGILWRDERPAYYGDKVGPLTLDDPLEASGKVAFTAAGSDSAAYVGWFDAASKRAAPLARGNEWEKNFLAVMVEGPSRVGHYFRSSYRCADGGGASPESGPVIKPDGWVHDWAIRYDPMAARGNGVITVSFDGRRQATELRPGDKARGATFDRFGVFNHQSGGNHVMIYLDDVTYTSRR
jgi:hypothetical protein